MRRHLKPSAHCELSQGPSGQPPPVQLVPPHCAQALISVTSAAEAADARASSSSAHVRRAMFPAAAVTARCGYTDWPQLLPVQLLLPAAAGIPALKVRGIWLHFRTTRNCCCALPWHCSLELNGTTGSGRPAARSCAQPSRYLGP